MTRPLHAAARLQQPHTLAMRRPLHADPEVGLQLPRTKAAILAALDGLSGLELSTGKRCTSVIGVLRGERSGPTVPGYPVTVNDAGVVERVRALATSILGPHAAPPMPDPPMGAENLSYVRAQVPGAMAFLGACPREISPLRGPANHSNRVVVDEDSLADGVALLAGFALTEPAGARCAER